MCSTLDKDTTFPTSSLEKNKQVESTRHSEEEWQPKEFTQVKSRNKYLSGTKKLKDRSNHIICKCKTEASSHPSHTFGCWPAHNCVLSKQPPKPVQESPLQVNKINSTSVAWHTKSSAFRSLTVVSNFQFLFLKILCYHIGEKRGSKLHSTQILQQPLSG